MSYTPRSAQHETIIEHLLTITPGGATVVENGDLTLVMGDTILWYVNYSDHYGYVIDYKPLGDWAGHTLVRDSDSIDHDELTEQIKKALAA